MNPQKRLHLRYCIRNANQIILKYKKIFIYHYRHSGWLNQDPLPVHNLEKIGCNYVGWFHVGHDAVGEVWKYHSKRHKIFVEMSLSPNNIIWHQDWVNKIKKLKKENAELDDYIKKLIKKTFGKNHIVP